MDSGLRRNDVLGRSNGLGRLGNPLDSELLPLLVTFEVPACAGTTGDFLMGMQLKGRGSRLRGNDGDFLMGMQLMGRGSRLRGNDGGFTHGHAVNGRRFPPARERRAYPEN